jgi:hypothetical protein
MSIDMNRLAVITWLAENARGLGRTALMKYCYFLQVVRGVPLGYRFSLYSYGPFDSDVLSDLDTAESMAGVKSAVAYHAAGYGYRIEPGDRADRITQLGAPFIAAHRESLQWVVDQFRESSASDLELASTLVYSDREAYRRNEELTISALSQRVRDVKPRFSIQQIENYGERLKQKGLLKAIQ